MADAFAFDKHYIAIEGNRSKSLRLSVRAGPFSFQPIKRRRSAQSQDLARMAIPMTRYRFRTSPIRNVAVQPTFMHNGAFTKLEDAVRHHLNVFHSALNYTPASQNLPDDLSGPIRSH